MNGSALMVWIGIRVHFKCKDHILDELRIDGNYFVLFGQCYGSMKLKQMAIFQR